MTLGISSTLGLSHHLNLFCIYFSIPSFLFLILPNSFLYSVPMVWKPCLKRKADTVPLRNGLRTPWVCYSLIVVYPCYFLLLSAYHINPIQINLLGQHSISRTHSSTPNIFHPINLLHQLPHLPLLLLCSLSVHLYAVLLLLTLPIFYYPHLYKPLEYSLAQLDGIVSCNPSTVPYS